MCAGHMGGIFRILIRTIMTEYYREHLGEFDDDRNTFLASKLDMGYMDQDGMLIRKNARNLNTVFCMYLNKVVAVFHMDSVEESSLFHNHTI